jgi:hypothetical protein
MALAFGTNTSARDCHTLSLGEESGGCETTGYCVTLSGPPAPLQTEFSPFCKMKYLLEKEIHNKNEENTWKELNEIFLTVYGLPK